MHDVYKEISMVHKVMIVNNVTGLHARPAAIFAKLAATFECDVYIKKEDKKESAKGILGVLMLGIDQGSEIEIITDGENEEDALKQLVSFIENLSD